MDDNWIAEHRSHVQHELLSGVYQVDVDRVQTALCTGAAGEEESIDVAYPADGVDYDRNKNRHANHVEVVYGDEVESSLCEKVGKLIQQKLPAVVP